MVEPGEGLGPGLRPPSQPPGPRVALKVQMLDDSVESFQLAVSQRDHRAPGKVLFDLVCVHLNLTEGDYFGLEYQDHRKMTGSRNRYCVPTPVLTFSCVQILSTDTSANI
uniref:FERM domain-containing protein n=1 Tax=Salarias fasciatus TaxID=181472 RepID=A0A672JAP6_SALFA